MSPSPRPSAFLMGNPCLRCGSFFASRSTLMAILIHTTRKHVWLGLLLFCVLWFDLFHIKCTIVPHFILFLEIFCKICQNALSLCVHVFMYAGTMCVQRETQARGQPGALFFRLHLPVLIYLLYTGSFTSLELIKLTRLASQ